MEDPDRMQAVRLSLALGQPLSVIRQMSIDDWNEYLWFSYVEPYGFEPLNSQFAGVRQILFNSNQKRSKQDKNTNNFKIRPFKGFMEWVRREEHERELELEREELEKTPEGRKTLIERARYTIDKMFGGTKDR